MVRFIRDGEDKALTKLECQHVFHTECATAWLNAYP